MSWGKVYDVGIFGFGVTGGALAWSLRYTNVKSVFVAEKYSRVATVNSHPLNNS
jgi:L-2-hydroxyglutarate oxidase LhgO